MGSRIELDEPIYSWWRYTGAWQCGQFNVWDEELRYWAIHYPGPPMWLARIAGYQGA